MRHTCINHTEAKGAVCRSQILGPSLFGIVYIKTVATVPQAIFYVFIAVVLLSLFVLFFIRIPPTLEEKTSVDEGLEVEVEAPAVARAVVSL